MALLLPWLVIAGLIFLNALYVAAEFAIIGVRPSRLGQLAEEGHRVAAAIHDTLRQPGRTDRYIATAQLGITLASLGLGMYAEPAIAHLIEGPLHDWFGLDEAAIHTVAVAIALAIITYLHVVVGEMVPKSLALQNSEGMALALHGPMALSGKLFAVPVVVLNKIGLLLLRLLGVRPPQSGRGYTPEELELIVTESMAGGLLEKREQEMVANIIDFGERMVVEVMTPRRQVMAIPVTTGQEELLELVEKAPYNRLPVYENSIDNIVGVLHLKDFIRQQLEARPFDLRGLVRQAVFVPETLLVEKLLATFRRQHLHLAIVIDEFGGTLGLVTLEDLVEEVVGEVHDEFDKEEVAPVQVIAPGHLLVQGRVILEDVEQYVSLGEHRNDVYTIAGLVLAELGHVAEAGEEVRLGDARVRIEKVAGLRVESLSVFYEVK
jgi:CBS domain containing-hemolysin-like protein